MDEKTRCQSCGMVLDIGLYGTNADGRANETYCKYCYENGSFREPNLKMIEMIARSAALMVDDKMDPEEAKQIANKIIPHLKRWEQKKP